VRGVGLEQVAHALDVARGRVFLQEHVGDHAAANLVGGAGGRLHDRDEDAQQHDRHQHGRHCGKRRDSVASERTQRLAQEEAELHVSLRMRIANSRVLSRAA
jgi:hypothetical protein